MLKTKFSAFSAFILTACFLSTSCTENPKSDQAEISEAREISSVEDAANLSIDKSKSTMSWVGTRPGKRHNGTIGIKDGNLQVAKNDLVGGTIILDMNNIDVLDIEGEDKQKLTRHLKSDDFFATEQHPEGKFEITSVEEISAVKITQNSNPQEDGEFKLSNPTHKITGNLTLRDKTLSISFPARIYDSNEEVRAEAKFNIDRTRWGVSYQDEAKAANKAKDKFIYNTVNVGLDIVVQK
ncbi:MAG: YceI family protein [Bacteroidota bacterium]|nr:YceI family protein [Bacteroidota bacterium]